ncbi:hypothetical protein [Thalassospira povalilytica]|uniref:hypothetical protein n=1 Tax=Thalassospira povalilytica TaxID=732237 RepID=UPI001D1820C0|nr:hypothetical protein [Thalassospira povalilytica]MCC4239091.1 hypothetical protein [Thalassospira povalilytica]
MNIEDLNKELLMNEALIVHCSCCGKAAEKNQSRTFPHDLRNAIDVLDSGNIDLSCSVIWAQHQHTFGDVGVILKVRDIDSITSVSFSDSGSFRDPETQMLCSGGEPLSDSSLADTFEKSLMHNEWTIKNSDVVAIYVKNFSDELSVSKYDLLEVHYPNKSDDFYELMGGKGTFCTELININSNQVEEMFPGLPLWSFVDGKVVSSKGNVVSLSSIYG